MDRKVNRIFNDPMDLPATVEAIKFRMKQSGLTSKISKPIGRKYTGHLLILETYAHIERLS
jgi:hypothetical protein